MATWRVNSQLTIGNDPSIYAHTSLTHNGWILSSDVTLHKECNVFDLTATPTADSDHFFIALTVQVGPDQDVFLPRASHRRFYACRKANWSLFRRACLTRFSRSVNNRRGPHGPWMLLVKVELSTLGDGKGTG